MGFKRTEKVICIKKGIWRNVYTGKIGRGPSYEEECVITGFHPEQKCFFIQGYSGAFQKKYFVLVDEITEIEVIEETIKKPEKIEV